MGGELASSQLAAESSPPFWREVRLAAHALRGKLEAASPSDARYKAALAGGCRGFHSRS